MCSLHCATTDIIASNTYTDRRNVHSPAVGFVGVADPAIKSGFKTMYFEMMFMDCSIKEKSGVEVTEARMTMFCKDTE